MTWYATYLIKQAAEGLTEDEARAVDEFLASGASRTVPTVLPYHAGGGAALGALLAPKLLSSAAGKRIKLPYQLIGGALLGGVGTALTGSALGEPPSNLPRAALIGAGVGAAATPVLRHVLQKRLGVGTLEGAVGGGLLGVATGLLHDYSRRRKLKVKLQRNLEESRRAYGDLPVGLDVYGEA